MAADSSSTDGAFGAVSTAVATATASSSSKIVPAVNTFGQPIMTRWTPLVRAGPNTQSLSAAERTNIMGLAPLQAKQSSRSKRPAFAERADTVRWRKLGEDPKVPLDQLTAVPAVVRRIQWLKAQGVNITANDVYRMNDGSQKGGALQMHVSIRKFLQQTGQEHVLSWEAVAPAAAAPVDAPASGTTDPIAGEDQQPGAKRAKRVEEAPTSAAQADA